MPLVDGVKRNVEQRRDLISGEGTFRLRADRFAGCRHVYRSDLGRWAVRLRAGPQCCHCSILHIPIAAASFQPATAELSPHLPPSAAFAAAVRELDRRYRFPDRPYMSSSRAAEACESNFGSPTAMRPLTAKHEGAGELVDGDVW